MNVWFRRLLLLLTIGGGFTGLAVAVGALFTLHEPSWIQYAILGLFIALYSYGIFIGIRLSEGSTPIWHLLFYFALQVPFISSPLFVYRFCSGLQATIAIVGIGLGWDCRFGSEFQLVILSSAPFGGGINLVALIVVFILCSPVFHSTDDAPAQA